MKLSVLLKPRRRQRGTAAVELAAVLPLLALLLTVPLFFGRVFWHYTVAYKAAHDAARYLATTSQADVLKLGPDGIAVAAKVANQIARLETAELNPGLYPPSIDVQCDLVSCTGGPPPKSVRVVVTMNMYDNIFTSSTTGDYMGDYGLKVKAEVAIPYVGN